jgi:hypothetical protein
MNRATITPLPCGKARLSWRGVDQVFADVFRARDEADAHRIQADVGPFPPPSIDHETEVLAVAPALRVP